MSALPLFVSTVCIRLSASLDSQIFNGKSTHQTSVLLRIGFGHSHELRCPKGHWRGLRAKPRRETIEYIFRPANLDKDQSEQYDR